MTQVPNVKTCFTELIASESISALDEILDKSNHGVIQLLHNWLSDLGFTCQTQVVKDTRDKLNLLATLIPQNGSNTGGLLLAGHTDTVPFDNNRWQSNPFKLMDKDNRWYGLGTCDMKGFFALVIAALEQIPLNQLNKPLYILATADEETTMKGAKDFAEHTDISPDYAIIGEPTSLKPVYMHKGHLTQGIRITGRSGHSSDPDKGLNAIEIMQKVIEQLLKLKQLLAEKYQETAFSVPHPTLNFGHIHGGDAVNRICGCCELHIDIRPIPGLPISELELLIKQFLSPIKSEYPNAIDSYCLYPPNEPFCGNKDDFWTQQASQLLNTQAEVVNYATEAPYISKLGCQTLVLGPGSIEQAHQPDEYLDTKFINPTITLLKELIINSCFNKDLSSRT